MSVSGRASTPSFAARLRLQATGIDRGPRSRSLRPKLEERGPAARSLVWDALELGALDERSGSVLDSALFHIFDDEERGRYVRVRSAIPVGGRYFMLCFSDRRPGEWGPRRVSAPEIRESFAEGWQLDAIEAVTLDITIDPAGAPRLEGGLDSNLDLRSERCRGASLGSSPGRRGGSGTPRRNCSMRTDRGPIGRPDLPEGGLAHHPAGEDPTRQPVQIGRVLRTHPWPFGSFSARQSAGGFSSRHPLPQTGQRQRRPGGRGPSSGGRQTCPRSSATARASQTARLRQGASKSNRASRAKQERLPRSNDGGGSVQDRRMAAPSTVAPSAHRVSR
jgi:hypothetical protein